MSAITKENDLETTLPPPSTGMSLSDQAAFLHSILEGSTQYSIVAKSLEGMILAWNEGAKRIYGYDPQDVVGKANSLILHDPADVISGKAKAILQEARGTGKWEGELKRIRKNGSRFTAYVTITLRKDPVGTPIGFTMISRDLTDNERVERELRESQEYNRGLIESNIDALMTTDPLGVISDVNRQMCEITGFAKEQLIGTPFKKYFTDPQRAEDGIRKVLSEERVTNYELTVRSKAGKETVVSYNATTFRSTDGKLKGVFAAARDITDQKRLEEDLRQAQNYTRGLIEASVDALVTVDPQMLVTDVNEQTMRITGYSREELVGSPFPDYFTEPERATEGVQKTLAEGFVTNYVLVLKSKSGTETTVSFNASVFKDTDGKVKGIFAAARDITAQIGLEADLRKAQNYTRGLIESSVDPMITVDPNLTITDVNQQMERLTETPKESLIGSRFDRYFTEPERAAAGVRKTLNENYVTNYDLTLRTPGGKEVLVSFNASVFKDPDGTVRGIFAVARDVTEQRRLENQVREEQNYNRGLIESSVDALMTVDPQGVITDINEQMVSMSGYSKKQLVGSRFADYFTDPERARLGVDKTFRDEVVTNYELVIKTKNAVTLPVSFNASVFKDTAGKVAGIFAAARDITAQKGLEQELREQQTYNRGLIESNIDALATTDTLGVITDVNKQMCAITGRSSEELIGKPFKDYFTEPKRAEDGIRKVLAEGRVTNYELTVSGADGKKTVVSYNATTFQGADGRLKGVFAAARDITDQKTLEDQLRQAQNYNRGLIESSVDAMLTVGLDITITDVNEQMIKLTGYTRDQLIGSSFSDYFTEPDRAADGVRKTLSEGFVTNYELLLRSRHRRQILVSFNASVFKDTVGNIKGIFAVARDVTEQRRLEEKLREQQNYNRGLIESSVDALVTVDPDLNITDVNEQMVKLTGYSREELTGSPFKDYFVEPERATSGVRQTLAEGSVTNYELTLKSRSGKRTVVSFNAGTFRDTEGKIAGILAAARDITAQKRLQEQLRDQQNYNRSLIESSVDALMTVDPNGVITDVNEQTVKLLGYNRKQLVGSPFVNYFTDSERANLGVRKTFDESFVTNYELTVRSKNGRKNPVSFNASVFRDASGEVVGILAAARDIVQQKQIEQELREQQTYTRGLIESNIDALMTTDTLGIITDVNKQMCAITGHNPEELIGEPFKNYFTNPTLAEDGIRKVLAEDRVTNYELTIRAKDGKETVVSYNATTFKGVDGRLRGVFAAARDITDQKRLEEQIRKQNRELIETTAFMNNVLESSTEYSIIAKDLEGNILAWNEGARRNYGYTPEETIGKMNSQMLHTPEDIASGKVKVLLDTALKTGKAEGVFDRVRKNKDRFTASLAVTLRRGADGSPIGYVLISKDITEQKRLEEQLRGKNEELEEQNKRVQQANRMKSEFLANMSHELRTPLNAIIGFSEIMHDGKTGPVSDRQKEYLKDILTSSEHLLQLINDVLDLAKVESGKMDFHPEKVHLEKLVGEVRDILRTLTQKKHIQIDVEIDPRTEEVELDPSKLKQVLYNYLSNALKFTPDRGKVAIRVKPEGESDFRLEVEDSGIGIKSEDMKKLFVEFQQLDGSTTKKYQGTGLGLALTKRIVETQGGKVGVRSTPSQGSVFYAVIPMAPQNGFSRISEMAKLPPPGLSKNPSLLVVEDNAKDRDWMVNILSAAGYLVTTASSAEEAIAKCADQPFDAITLDIYMSPQNGGEVLKSLKAGGLNEKTPVLIASVIADIGFQLGYEVQDFVQKPIKAGELLDSLRRAGIPSGKEVRVLMVDDDPKTLKAFGTALTEEGYLVDCQSGAEDGLKAALETKPSVVLLDLMMPEMDGFVFLEKFRKTEAGGTTPVIICSAKDLTAEDRERLKKSQATLGAKKIPNTILQELKRIGLRGLHE